LLFLLLAFLLYCDPFFCFGLSSLWVIATGGRKRGGGYLAIYLSIEDTEQHIAAGRGVGISWPGLPGGTGGGGILDDL
jgi:hypothetical protein